MTSPIRKLRDRSRKQFSNRELLEIAEEVRQSFASEKVPGAKGKAAPLSRSDMQLIGRAVTEGWDIPYPKRVQIMQQVFVTMDSEDSRVVIAAARLLMKIVEANELIDHHGSFPGHSH